MAYVDRNGMWLEIAWDIFSLGMSVVDVWRNPTDPLAWAGLAGDAVDVLVPCFGGIGETIKGARTVGAVAGKVDDVVDAAKTIYKINDVADAAADVVKTADTVKDAAKAAKKATGQYHHVLSNPIMKAINKNPNLKGKFDRASSVIQALTEEAHKGYQKWHRKIDKDMVKWLGDNEGATVKEFWEKMKGFYNTDDMKERFGNTVLDYINDMLCKEKKNEILRLIK